MSSRVLNSNAEIDVRSVKEDDLSALPRFAIILNPKARRVTKSVIAEAILLAGEENVFLSLSSDELEVALTVILDRRYAIVACGGGDGTVACIVNALDKMVNQRHSTSSPVERPALAVLRLGTGNAVARLVGSAPSACKDLRRLASPSRPSNVCMVHPIQLNHDVTCFLAGVGIDATWLSHYETLKQQSARWSAIHWLIRKAPIGYLTAFVTKTLPWVWFRARPLHVRVQSKGEAFYIDPKRGDVAMALPADRPAVIFEGTCWLVAAGTVPFYGAGLRLFPFAGLRPGFMHLRIARIPPIMGLVMMVPIWRGHYRNRKGCLDFLVKEVTVDLDEVAPTQHSGEPFGRHKQLHFKVGDNPLPLVDFMS